MTLRNGRSTPLEDTYTKGPLPAAEVSGKAVATRFAASDCGNTSRYADPEIPPNNNELTKDPALPQYLYVQSPAGKRFPGVFTPRTGLTDLPVSPDQTEQFTDVVSVSLPASLNEGQDY